MKPSDVARISWIGGISSEFAARLLDGDPDAERTGQCFRALVNAAICCDYLPNGKRMFRRLFVRRDELQQRAIEETLDRHLDMAEIEGESLSSAVERCKRAGLFVDGHEQGTLCSGVMIHRDLVPLAGEMENPDTAATDRPGLRSWTVATDWPDVPLGSGGRAPGIDAVFPIHFESAYLLEQLRRRWDTLPKSRVLDIFCGSGIFGLYCFLSGAQEVVCSDVSIRALAFCRLNAILNGVSPKAAFYLSLSDVFDSNPAEHRWAGVPLTEARFDLILCNAPFEPGPALLEGKYFIHSYGGPFGDKSVNRFLEEVAGHLLPGGEVAGVTFSCSESSEPGFHRLHRNSDKDKVPWHGVNPHLHTEQVDSVPLRHFARRYELLFANAEPAISNWLTELEGHNVASLRLMFFHTWDNAPSRAPSHEALVLDRRGLREPTSGGARVPHDFTLPLKWLRPCGLPVSSDELTVLLIDPPLHTYFAKDQTTSDQHRNSSVFDLPLNHLALGSYILENLPGVRVERVFHLDWAWSNSRAHREPVPSEPYKQSLWKLVKERLAQADPPIDVVCVGALTIQADLVRVILEAVHDHAGEILTVGGGPHISFMAGDYLTVPSGDGTKRLLDLVIAGEGEYGIEWILQERSLFDDQAEFLAALRSERLRLPPNSILLGEGGHGLVEETPAAWLRTTSEDAPATWYSDLLPDPVDAFLGSAQAVVLSKRGCQHSCEFCVSKCFLPARVVVSRPISVIVAELQELRLFDVEDIELLDEVFAPAEVAGRNGRRKANPDLQLCRILAGVDFEGMRFAVQTRADALVRPTPSGLVPKTFSLAAMRAARITTVLIGVESAVDRVLHLMRKDEDFRQIDCALKEASRWGFLVGTFWIMAFPGAQPEEDIESVNAISRLRNERIVNWCEVNLFVPYPGTDFDPLRRPQALPPAAAEVDFTLRMPDHGKTEAFERWLRFGESAQPVFTVSNYSPEDVRHLRNALASAGAPLTSPPPIPFGPSAVQRRILKDTADLIHQLAATYEKSLATAESVESSANQSRGLHGITYEQLASDVVNRCFLAVQTTDDQRGAQLGPIACATVAALSSISRTAMRELVGSRISALVFAPLELNSSEALNHHDSTLGVYVRVSDSPVNVTAGAVPELFSCLGDLGSRPSLRPYDECPSRFVGWLYETYKDTGLGRDPLHVRLLETSAGYGDRRPNGHSRRLPSLADQLRKARPEAGLLTSRWLIAIEFASRDAHSHSDDELPSYNLTRYLRPLIELMMSHLAASLALTVEADIAKSIAKQRAALKTLAETYEVFAHEQVKGFRGFADSRLLTDLREYCENRGDADKSFELGDLQHFLDHGLFVTGAFSKPHERYDRTKHSRLDLALADLHNYTVRRLLPWRCKDFLTTRRDEYVQLVTESVLGGIHSRCFNYAGVRAGSAMEWGLPPVLTAEGPSSRERTLQRRLRLQAVFVAAYVNALEHVFASLGMRRSSSSGNQFRLRPGHDARAFSDEDVLSVCVFPDGFEILNLATYEPDVNGKAPGRSTSGGTEAVLKVMLSQLGEDRDGPPKPLFEWDASCAPTLVDGTPGLLLGRFRSGVRWGQPFWSQIGRGAK